MTNDANDVNAEATDPTRITDETTPDGVDGVADGNPIAGVEIDEAELDRAVEPDDKSVDGPPAGHA